MKKVLLLALMAMSLGSAVFGQSTAPMPVPVAVTPAAPLKPVQQNPMVTEQLDFVVPDTGDVLFYRITLSSAPDVSMHRLRLWASGVLKQLDREVKDRYLVTEEEAELPKVQGDFLEDAKKVTARFAKVGHIDLLVVESAGFRAVPGPKSRIGDKPSWRIGKKRSAVEHQPVFIAP